MAEKLTGAERATLSALSECTAPWDARSRSNIIVLRALQRLGLAEMRVGYPVGFVITPAGRASLSKQEE